MKKFNQARVNGGSNYDSLKVRCAFVSGKRIKAIFILGRLRVKHFPEPVAVPQHTLSKALEIELFVTETPVSVASFEAAFADLVHAQGLCLFAFANSRYYHLQLFSPQFRLWNCRLLV